MRMWNALVKMGFKEIEIGFPSRLAKPILISAASSSTTNCIPDDVTIQVSGAMPRGADHAHV